jgi:hypothetical protein
MKNIAQDLAENLNGVLALPCGVRALNDLLALHVQCEAKFLPGMQQFMVDGQPVVDVLTLLCYLSGDPLHFAVIIDPGVAVDGKEQQVERFAMTSGAGKSAEHQAVSLIERAMAGMSLYQEGRPVEAEATTRWMKDANAWLVAQGGRASYLSDKRLLKACEEAGM